MSAFGGKADIMSMGDLCLLMTQSGHWCCFGAAAPYCHSGETSAGRLAIEKISLSKSFMGGLRTPKRTAVTPIMAMTSDEVL
jgi:hypothetical protein